MLEILIEAININDTVADIEEKLSYLNKLKQMFMTDSDGDMLDEINSKIRHLAAALEKQKKVQEDRSEVEQQDEGKKLDLGSTIKLSSAEYQKVKKLKSFNKDDWKWNGDLYVKVVETTEFDEGKSTYLVKAETGPHQYSEMKIDATSPAEAEKIFRKSYKHPMGLTVTKLKESVEQLEESYYDDDLFFETYGWLEDNLEEAEYRGRKVKLGKPMQGDVKKFKVYVKDPKTGNVKKVNFGHGGSSVKGKAMRIRKNNPKARKSFRARHNCDNPGSKLKARYWSCKAW